MDFQTPFNVAKYMVGIARPQNDYIMEPTPGDGNIVYAISLLGLTPVMPGGDFWEMDHKIKYGSVVMNPPFSPMKLGYKFLYKCMELSDDIVALMPWLTIINGEGRTNDIMNFGLISITHLPRNIFKGSRVQCCILHMNRGWKEPTIFYKF